MSQSRGLTSKLNTIRPENEPFSFVDLKASRSKSALHVLRQPSDLIGDDLRESTSIIRDDLRQATDSAGDNDSAYFSLKDQVCN